MTIEVGLLLTLAAGLISFSTFWIGRRSAAKKDGEEWGELKADIRYIKQDCSEIKVSVEKNNGEAMAAIAREGQERRESIRRVHNRIDELAKYVNAPINNLED